MPLTPEPTNVIDGKPLTERESRVLADLDWAQTHRNPALSDNMAEAMQLVSRGSREFAFFDLPSDFFERIRDLRSGLHTSITRTSALVASHYGNFGDLSTFTERIWQEWNFSAPTLRSSSVFETFVASGVSAGCISRGDSVPASATLLGFAASKITGIPLPWHTDGREFKKADYPEIFLILNVFGGGTQCALLTPQQRGEFVRLRTSRSSLYESLRDDTLTEKRRAAILADIRNANAQINTLCTSAHVRSPKADQGIALLASDPTSATIHQNDPRGGDRLVLNVRPGLAIDVIRKARDKAA